MVNTTYMATAEKAITSLSPELDEEGPGCPSRGLPLAAERGARRKGWKTSKCFSFTSLHRSSLGKRQALILSLWFGSLAKMRRNGGDGSLGLSASFSASAGVKPDLSSEIKVCECAPPSQHRALLAPAGGLRQGGQHFLCLHSS